MHESKIQQKQSFGPLCHNWLGSMIMI